MTKLTVLIRGSKHQVILEKSVRAKRVVPLKATVFWRYNNVRTDDKIVTNGTDPVPQEEPVPRGYYTFDDLADMFKKSGHTLAREVGGKSKLTAGRRDLHVAGAICEVIGFDRPIMVPAGASKTSQRPSDTLAGLRYLNVRCNIVKTGASLDTKGRETRNLVTIPPVVDAAGAIQTVTDINHPVEVGILASRNVEFEVVDDKGVPFEDAEILLTLSFA